MANQYPTGTGDRYDQQGRPIRGEYNHFYNNDMVPPTVNSGLVSGMEMDPGSDSLKLNDKVDEHQLADTEGNEGNNDQHNMQININAPQRSNQLKLQEFSKPKSISIEVLSSKSKVSVNIDSTTVSK